MKSNIFKSMAVVAVAIFAGYNVYQSNVNNEEMSSIVLENVEALADEENGNGGLFEYPDGFPYSFTCNVKTGEGIIFDDYCSATVVTCQGGGRGCNSRRCPVHG